MSDAWRPEPEPRPGRKVPPDRVKEHCPLRMAGLIHGAHYSGGGAPACPGVAADGGPDPAYTIRVGCR